MPWVRCHHCHEWSYTDDVRETPPPEVIARLSPAALTIVNNTQRLPADFRRGLHPIPLRMIADLVGYSSHSSVRQGLIELAEFGFVRYVTYGPTKHRYTLAERRTYHRAA